MSEKENGGDNRGGRGGDFTFATGEGAAPTPYREAGLHGDLIFKVGGHNGMEVMRFSGDGTVVVRGEKVDSNKEVYRAFWVWLETIGAVR